MAVNTIYTGVDKSAWIHAKRRLAVARCILIVGNIMSAVRRWRVARWPWARTSTRTMSRAVANMFALFRGPSAAANAASDPTRRAELSLAARRRAWNT